MLITTTQTRPTEHRDSIATIAHNFDPIMMPSQLLTNHNWLLDFPTRLEITYTHPCLIANKLVLGDSISGNNSLEDLISISLELGEIFLVLPW